MHCRPFHTLRCGFSAVVLLALSFHSATQTGVSAAEPGEAGSKTLAVFRLSSVSESAQGDDMPFGGGCRRIAEGANWAARKGGR